VVDELGRPLAGALVVALGTPPGAAAAAIGARPDAIAAFGARRYLRAAADRPSCAIVASTATDGHFSLPVLPAGRYFLFAVHIGPPAVTSESLSLDGGGFLTVPLRLVISRGGSIL
jgi:hypothetical protein